MNIIPGNDDFTARSHNLRTAEVVASIACPTFVICMCIMLVIWFYQRRKSQLPTYNGVNSEDNRSIEIPPGMSLNALSDISTGTVKEVL